MSQLQATCDLQTVVNMLVCMQSLTSDDQDILVEFKDLDLVSVLLDLLQAHRSHNNIICHILSTLTNLALND